MQSLFDTSFCGCSSKREPLGKGYVRGHKIPDGLGTQTPFGAAIHAKVSCIPSAKVFNTLNLLLSVSTQQESIASCKQQAYHLFFL